MGPDRKFQLRLLSSERKRELKRTHRTLYFIYLRAQHYRRYFKECRRYRECLRRGRPYFGPLFGALQGDPRRHFHMDALVRTVSSETDQPVRILEVGSWAGGSAITWAKALSYYSAKGGAVVCVDPWAPYIRADEIDNLTLYEMRRALEGNKILQLFLHNVRSAQCVDVVIPIVGTLRRAADQIKGEFDIVFLDGDHSYDAVRCDIDAATPLVREGGVLCGDDLELQLGEVSITDANRAGDFVFSAAAGSWFHPGVTLAVGEAFGQIKSYLGFWAVQRRGRAWRPVDLDTGGREVKIPGHLIARD